ncbi:carbohydrate ABC transporter permease [Amphibacillus sp. MSJ-3]|uniref:carbohydrate ABC transporter permease n=1 Tax=Amphibacillus sp. MSJ-3 TaxID=2841505 RepID=UPI001C0ED268|nr:carbohydrate ABC transporter permease [Amphibacillus sp. MSJ-3]MBU5594302.1 carbohydrate ABC transporter permease [Amphibacillus sp. MSJ-3]
MKRKGSILSYLFLGIGFILIFIPLYMTVISSFKETYQITGDFFGLPNPFTLGNFQRILSDGITQYFFNSTLISVISICLITFFIPMAAFSIARNISKNKAFALMYSFLILGIFVPFQVIMIPITTMMTKLGLSNIPGLIILYLAYAVPQTLFLYVGYIKTGVPAELDEAAEIDGCGKFKMYFSIAFPLMKPMHATALIINALWIWNDFLLPLLILNKDSSNWTLPLFQYNYQGQYFNDFGPSFASYVVGIVVILIVYLIFQKSIISGMTSGSVK